MTGRVTRQKKIDDRAWPVRLLIYVPHEGFGSRYGEVYAWLDEHIGTTDYALHSGPRYALRDSIAIYLRHPAKAVAFLQAFTDLELADGTEEDIYSSPKLPFGRTRNHASA